MSKPLVAIVGRPNVGKSTFFNYIVGKRISIVEDKPGVTRDRVYADADWRGRKFSLIDTGGIEPESEDIILSQMREQANIAINVADVIIFLTDIKQGVTAADMEIAQMLRVSKKKVILVCNKADNYGKTSDDIYEFYNLGLGDPYPVSSVNAIGIGDVLDAIYENFPEKTADEDDDVIRVAIIGKPNVGKSSLVNKILGENRVIVSNIAGTTRDAIDSEFQNEFGKYVFIDTAGIRRKSKVDEQIEKYSVIRSLLAVERADVCILMIDANEGVTEQDAKIAGEAHEAGKGVIIAINKWDEYEDKDEHSTEKYKKEVYNKLSYLSYAPIIFISAKTGQRVSKLFEIINMVASQNAMRVSTAVLNQVLNEAIAIVQPPSDKGKRLKVYYMTQASTKPPTFVVFVNDKKLFHFSYERYLVNQIRKEFTLTGTPVRIIVREKKDKDNL